MKIYVTWNNQQLLELTAHHVCIFHVEFFSKLLLQVIWRHCSISRPLKKSENSGLLFSRGYRKKSVTWNGLKDHSHVQANIWQLKALSKWWKMFFISPKLLSFHVTNKKYLTSTFTKTSFFICLILSQHYISL